MQWIGSKGLIQIISPLPTHQSAFKKLRKINLHAATYVNNWSIGLGAFPNIQPGAISNGFVFAPTLWTKRKT